LDRLDLEELGRYLKDRLPDYMVPNSFVELEKLPLTANGKVDRQSLPQPESAAERRMYVAPGNRVEKLLSEIWGRVLGVERVGIRENFFALGGDSILSIEVLSQAKKAGLNFSLAQLFEQQTIEALAQTAIMAPDQESVILSPTPFGLITDEDRLQLPKDIEDAYPLSKLQHGMLFHTEYSPDTPVYYNITSYHLRARLDVALLQQTVEQMVRRHPVLRTSFHFIRYTPPLQLVHERGEISLQVEDLRHLSLEQQEEALKKWMEAEKKRGFDPRRPGLLRFHVHRRSEDTFQFTKTEHHAILDGWSEATLVTELFACYM